MKSYNQWENQLTLNEFIGPRGQVDPMGFAPVAQTTPQPIAAQPVAKEMDVSAAIQQFIQRLRTKPVQYIMQVQATFNSQLQDILADKSKTAGQSGVLSQFNTAGDAKQNWGKPQ